MKEIELRELLKDYCRAKEVEYKDYMISYLKGHIAFLTEEIKNKEDKAYSIRIITYIRGFDINNKFLEHLIYDKIVRGYGDNPDKILQKYQVIDINFILNFK